MAKINMEADTKSENLILGMVLRWGDADAKLKYHEFLAPKSWFDNVEDGITFDNTCSNRLILYKTIKPDYGYDNCEYLKYKGDLKTAYKITVYLLDEHYYQDVINVKLKKLFSPKE